MAKEIKKSNAERFISAYNEIDHALRTIYGFKRSISNADLIRKSVPLNSVVRKYEDELIDYGRLRNSIVHKTNPNYVIAEPHDEVVEDFEKIAKLISTPPKALERVCVNDVSICDGKINLKTLFKLIENTGHKNIPVYENNVLIGVSMGTVLLTKISEVVAHGEDVDEYLENTKVSEIVSKLEENGYFRLTDKNITIEKALNHFYNNRRLQLILITNSGSTGEKPLGIITISDILDMNEILENYQ